MYSVIGDYILLINGGNKMSIASKNIREIDNHKDFINSLDIKQIRGFKVEGASVILVNASNFIKKKKAIGSLKRHAIIEGVTFGVSKLAEFAGLEEYSSIIRKTGNVMHGASVMYTLIQSGQDLKLICSSEEEARKLGREIQGIFIAYKEVAMRTFTDTKDALSMLGGALRSSK